MKKIDLGQAISVLADLGVLAGIVFLAIEMQQNNKLLRAEATGRVLETRLARQELVLSGVDLAALLQRNETQESLSQEDLIRMKAARDQGLIGWQRD